MAASVRKSTSAPFSNVQTYNAIIMYICEDVVQVKSIRLCTSGLPFVSLYGRLAVSLGSQNL